MQKELLSAYMDGEQMSNELTATLCQDENLRKTWANYHLIGSVMRKESAVVLGTDFTEKMAMLIEQEDTIQVSQPTPDEVATLPFVQKLKAMFAPLTQVAVAAGVCLVAVIGVQSYNASQAEKNTADNPVLQTLPFNNSVQEVSYNAPAKDVVSAEQLEQKNKRIGLMLQNYELQRRVQADNARNLK